MSGEARCEHTDLPVDGCAHCRPPAETTVLAGIDVIVTIPARHDGRCGYDPDHPVREGEWIGRTEEHGWICQVCCEEARRYRP